MAKKATPPSVDKIVKKVNKELEKTARQIESLINDALKQLDALQNQIHEPIQRLLKEADELREREMKRLHDEFERRLSEFHELQGNVLERLGLASREAEKKAGKLANKASDNLPGTEGKTDGKSAEAPASKKTTTGKKSAAPKNTAKKTVSASSAGTASKAADHSDLTRVKGIGPATAQKMRDAGITSIEQIANPGPADEEKLQAFSSLRGFSTLREEAKKVL
jgi:predicted flap endonuclease-1-like 5' DNA nuclease